MRGLSRRRDRPMSSQRFNLAPPISVGIDGELEANDARIETARHQARVPSRRRRGILFDLSGRGTVHDRVGRPLDARHMACAAGSWYLCGMAAKYELPRFLTGVLNDGEYRKWLTQKAKSHAARDRRRGEFAAPHYKEAIHAAVIRSEGRDHYTRERLDWSLVSKYNNEASRKGGIDYKKKFALLPTVDHVAPGSRNGGLEICGWRTNDCKNDLSLNELKAFCRKLLKTQGG